MGARGPKPKPAELQLLEGGRGHRPINLDQAFRPEVGEPDMPRWLSKEGRKAWKRLAAELLHYNLLSKVDRESFAMLCQTVGRLELIELAIAGRMRMKESQGGVAIDALMDTTPKGLAQQSAIYTILNREQAKLNSLLAEFGMTPAQRARVSTSIRTQTSLFDANADRPDTQPIDTSAPKGFSGFPDK
jgi:P27 family predicted phage terminase small subunit